MSCTASILCACASTLTIITTPHLRSRSANSHGPHHETTLVCRTYHLLSHFALVDRPTSIPFTRALLIA